MSYNKVILLGNLTRDPALSYLPNNTPVVDFGLAMNHRWGKGHEKKESVCFVDCRCFGANAETLNKYMRKGMPLLVEGRLEQDTWTTNDGQKRSKHRVFVEKFTFLGQGEKKPEPKPPETEYTPDGHEIPF